MQQGADVIYQATLLDSQLIGHADFLLKRPGKSIFGDYFYEVADTKLARSGKAKFVVQIGYYSMLLAKTQQAEPEQMYVILGNMQEATYRFIDYAKYIQVLTERFLNSVPAAQSNTYPHPCDKCRECRWDDLCSTRREKDGHLSGVANITRLQIRKLEEFGIRTIDALAALPEGSSLPKMDPEILERLRKQAALQQHGKRAGSTQFELISLPGPDRESYGFARLPVPDEGDLFFDMEGNPLEENGLEYLFGLYYFEQGKAVFKPFWALNQAREKRAFEQFMDFVIAHMKRFPNAHIYHYATYEEAAIKRLMTYYGTREFEVDTLLRQKKLVDLYKVVREGLRISEDSYSIKSVEKLYMPSRNTAVKQGGASIVYFENWKDTGQTQYLKDIKEYNKDDVISTYLLREWLIKHRPEDTPWWKQTSLDSAATNLGDIPKNAYEVKIAEYREALIGYLSDDEKKWSDEDRFRVLTFQLLDFHRRAQKPQWWEKFRRKELQLDQLKEDPETLAGLVLESDYPKGLSNDQFLYKYRFPEQDTKLKTGDKVAVIEDDSLEVSQLVINEDELTASFCLKVNQSLSTISLGPTGPLNTKPLPDAIARFADSVVDNSHAYPAIESILRRKIPNLKGKSPGAPILPPNDTSIASIIKAVDAMDHTHLFIQGPPGAGKTYTASRVIAALLRNGKRIGIASNSHKAIHNLLEEVEKVATKEKIPLKGAKKVSKDKPDTFFESPNFVNLDDAGKVARTMDAKSDPALLIAGTAWLFGSKTLIQKLDYLFIDEAGQVALANLVAMGVSTKNIVLMGDQMQLSQPVQGAHPGRSGDSTLDYLLDSAATIPPDRGIFLSKTYRMHPDVSEFISDAVYDGRLISDESTHQQRLLLLPDAHPSLKPTGIRFIPLDHQACSQKSAEEAALINEIYASILKQKWIDGEGVEHTFTTKDILVVAPYNQQVNLLSQRLPKNARVGTVDKFQGQEGQVVIMSMTTSSGEELPRHMEFLFSKNRINVALSRARCLALLICNPKLLSIKCVLPEQMSLVNTLCWLKKFE